jgi:hypothetical protein
MKSFNTTEEQRAAITAAMTNLFDVCKAAGVPAVAAACVEIDKVKTEEGFGVTTSIARMAHLNGVDRVPDELRIIAAFSDSLEGGIEAVQKYQHMVATFGALIMEDEPEAACLHFLKHGDTDAARRIGGSLPPL